MKKYYFPVTIALLALIAILIFADEQKASPNWLYDYREVVLEKWSLETNQVKVGLYVQVSPNVPRRVPIQIFFRFAGTNDDNAPYLLLPVDRARYKLSMSSADGTPVNMTSYGKSFGQEPTLPSRTHVFRTHSGGLPKGVDAIYCSTNAQRLVKGLVLEDFFNIDHSGMYHLNVEIRAFDNRGRKWIRIPVTCDIDLHLMTNSF